MENKYLLIEAIEECISNCISCGSAEVKKGKDDCGVPLVWLSAEWVSYDDTHDVVELYTRFTDTGRIAFSQVIRETITEA